MVAVEFEELCEAHDFVNFGSWGDNRAYLSLDTGEVHWVSEVVELDQDLPQDLETSDRYLAVPDKHDLDLRKRLVLRFAAEVLPESRAPIAAFFDRPGAYARFKDLLAEQDALDRWYRYEEQATEHALREWCAEHGIELVERSSESAAAPNARLE